MHIRIFTDLEDPSCVLMDLSSLIHACKYANKEGNHIITKTLMSMFHQDQEMIKIEKDSDIYSFLKKCPNVIIDEITWQMIKEAYLIARLQNNGAMLRELGKILSHWEQYVIEQTEFDGLATEVATLSNEARNFVLKYHDCYVYEEQKRKKIPKVKENKDTITNRSVVEMGTKIKSKKVA